MIINFLKHKRLKFRVNRVKKAILNCRIITQKDDFAIAGMLGLLASTNIFKEFLNFDSENEEDFESTKKCFLVLMQDQVLKFQRLKYKNFKNKDVVEFKGNEKDE